MASNFNLYASVLSALAERGLAPVDPRYLKMDGSVCRFRCEGDKKPNGWAIVHADGSPVLIAGHWARGEQHVVALGEARRLSPREEQAARHAVEVARRQRERELAERHDAAQTVARRLWAASGLPFEWHPYLVEKMLLGVGIRQLNRDLLIPMRDESGEVWNVQRIREDGEKRFLKGGRVRGLSFWLGAPTSEVIVCEGWATGAVLHLSTRKHVRCAMAAGNLAHVAQQVRKATPDS